LHFKEYLAAENNFNIIEWANNYKQNDIIC